MEGPNKPNPNLFSDVAGFTGNQPTATIKDDPNAVSDTSPVAPVPHIHIQDTEDVVGGVATPHEETSSSESSAKKSEDPPLDGSPKVETESDCGPRIGGGGSKKLKSLGDMVTGHSLQLPNTRTRRRLSLQSDTGTSLHPDTAVGGASGGTRARTYSDLNRRAKLLNLDLKKTEEELSVRTPTTDGDHPRPPYLRSKSGPPTTTPLWDSSEQPRQPTLPTPLTPYESSSKPPGIERQDSHGENEFVVGNIGKKLPTGTGKACLENLAVLQTDTQQVPLPHSRPQEPPGGLNIGPPVAGAEEEVVVTAVQEEFEGQCHAQALQAVGLAVEHADSEGYERVLSSSGSGSGSGCGSGSGSGSSEVPSETVLYQVHLLGHACNQQCYNKVSVYHQLCPKAQYPRLKAKHCVSLEDCIVIS